MNETKTPQDKLLFGLGLGLIVLVLAVAIVAAAVVLSTGRAMLEPLLPKAPEPTEPPPPANIYSEADFALEGNYLTCLAGQSMLGIDVSEWNGNIDWQAVKEAGIQFVFIRAGGRGWGQAGVLYPDGMAQSHYEGAKAAGLLVGAYFFSQATNEEEGREEARYCLELIKDWELELPVVMDWEYISEEARTAGLTRRQRTDSVLGFCAEIRRSGHVPMLYTGAEIRDRWMYPKELENIPFWLAMYSTKMDYPYRFACWQYTGSGRVPGITGDVDINIMPII